MKSLFAKVAIIPTSLLENLNVAFYVEGEGWTNSLSGGEYPTIIDCVNIDEEDNSVAVYLTEDYFGHIRVKWPTKSALLPIIVYKRDFSKYEQDPWLWKV